MSNFDEGVILRAHRFRAEMAGYRLERGHYMDGEDDRADRWYVVPASRTVSTAADRAGQGSVPPPLRRTRPSGWPARGRGLRPEAAIQMRRFEWTPLTNDAKRVRLRDGWPFGQPRVRVARMPSQEGEASDPSLVDSELARPAGQGRTTLNAPLTGGTWAQRHTNGPNHRSALCDPL